MSVFDTLQRTKYPEVKLKNLLSAINTKSKKDVAFITKAYNFAKDAHKEQKRYSGEPYFNHCFATAYKLATLDMSPTVIAAGLLHDSVEDVDGIEYEDIEKEFGEEVAKLVEGVTKLGTVRYHGLKRHAESLRKLFAATSQDIRVMIIKLADRLHNANTLSSVPKHKQKRIAQETIEIYAPIADRLGMSVIKQELEDAAFRFAYPKEYKRLVAIASDRYDEATKTLTKTHKSVKKKLAEYGIIDFRTEIRLKGIYSLYKKLERKDWDIDKIRDITALRIILKTTADCYTVLGIMHAEWRPMPGKIKDYIAFPKPNGYQSIHSTLFAGDGSIFEIQIRTEEMHREALFGVASHLTYKEQSSGNTTRSSGMEWVKQFIPARLLYNSRPKDILAKKKKKTHYTNDSVPDWIKDIADARKSEDEPDKYIETIKNDFFSHRIFVFTPTGDVIDLPISSSPIDFAYAIHSDIGNHMAGAKVNKQMKAIDTELHNGDIVEIITKPTAHPTRKWLDMARTNTAKKFIRLYLSRKNKKEEQ